MATITDIVIDEQIDDADLETPEETDTAKVVHVGVTAFAVAATVAYFGVSRFLRARQEKREIETLNELYEKIAVLEACDTPVVAE